jgi:hypothetical protein
MRQGWVYVMVNASMRNLVKVGQTAREPRLRVAELSSATGVPTPFMLEFRQLYADCERAEREIHEVLDARGLRVSANREFFHGPARTIVRIIMAHAAREPWPPPLTQPGPCDGDISQAQAEFLRTLARRQQLYSGAQEGDPFCYTGIAMLAAQEGQTEECLRAWDLFFATHGASSAELPDAATGSEGAGHWHDPRMIPACRRYIACCLLLGRVPGYRSVLLRAADDMLDQQLADLRRLRGTQAAARLSAVMRWIYENLEPDAPGDAGLPDLDAAASGTAARSETAAA